MMFLLTYVLPVVVLGCTIGAILIYQDVPERKYDEYGFVKENEL